MAACLIVVVLTIAAAGLLMPGHSAYGLIKVEGGSINFVDFTSAFLEYRWDVRRKLLEATRPISGSERIELTFNVEVDGKVSNCHIDKSSGDKAIDDAVMQSVSKLTFPTSSCGITWESLKITEPLSYAFAAAAQPGEKIKEGVFMWHLDQGEGIEIKSSGGSTTLFGPCSLSGVRRNPDETAVDASGPYSAKFSTEEKRVKGVLLAPKSVGGAH